MLLAKLKLIVVGFRRGRRSRRAWESWHRYRPRSNRPPDPDRLKAVEQKLDRLLEVLGALIGPAPGAKS